MALVESISIGMGTPMSTFELKDPSGRKFHSDALFGPKGLVVAFTCNHCPYAVAVWPRLIKLASYAQSLGINTVAINPNINPGYPDDAPDQMLKKIKEWGIDFPYLVDESQNVAREFKAQCTPDLYLFDNHKKLVYHGRFDDNWQDETKIKRNEFKDAVINLANGKPISSDQKPSMGCSIKWR